MKNELRYARLAVLLGSVFILGGMNLNDMVEFAPVIGWLGGLVLFMLATVFASRVNWQKKRSM